MSWTSRGMIVLAGVLLLTAHQGCRRREAPRRELTEEALTGGQLIFKDDFERDEIGDQWIVRAPTWTIEDGWLHDTKARNEGAWLDLELPDRVRIEFDARSEIPSEGAFRGDIKCEVFATEPDHEKGYVLIFGGWQNALNVVARLDEHGADRLEMRGRKVVAGQTYRFTIVRTDGVLHWLIDGKPFMRYEDPDPVRGRYFGFNNWESKIYFDNLRIFELGR